MCVCRFGISFTYVIEGIDSKLISVCLTNDYSLIADLHIFVYGRAECFSISLECIKVKLFILNNFGQYKRPKHNQKFNFDNSILGVFLPVANMTSSHNDMVNKFIIMNRKSLDKQLT